MSDAESTKREYAAGGWLEQMGGALWRVSGNYMYGSAIENIPTRKLAIEILEALDETADAVRDACFSS